MSAEKRKALCPGSGPCQMAAPPARPLSSKAGLLLLLLVQCGPNMCLRKTGNLIYGVNFHNTSHSSQGRFRCVSAFGALFSLPSQIENNDLSCHVRMMLLQCCQYGESESCFPSGGDRRAMTHSSAFTCSPLKQRRAFHRSLRAELMAFP